MKNNLFNHDRLNTWQKCPRMYYYKYIKELRYPEFHQDYELGRAVHSLIDYKLRSLDTEHLLQGADEEILGNWNSIKNHPIMDKRIITTEWGFNTQVPETPCWLIGRIDAVFYDKENGKYIIADWKTGKFTPQKIHTNFQHKVYLYAFYQSRKDLGLEFAPEDLCFRYFKIANDDIEITEIKFSQETLAEYEESFRNIINRIDKMEHFPSEENCSVKYCQYKGLCFN